MILRPAVGRILLLLKLVIFVVLELVSFGGRDGLEGSLRKQKLSNMCMLILRNVPDSKGLLLFVIFFTELFETSSKCSIFQFVL